MDEVDVEGWDRKTSRCADCGGERVVYAGSAPASGGTSVVFGAFRYDHPGHPEVFTHPRIEEFWTVNDAILSQIKEIGELFSPSQERSRSRWSPFVRKRTSD